MACSLSRRGKPSRRAARGCMAADGDRGVVCTVRALHYPPVPVRAPDKEQLAAAGGQLEAAPVGGWGDLVNGLAALAARVAEALERCPPPDALHVVCTRNSVHQR